MTRPSRVTVVLAAILAVCVVRLWISPLWSSFWVDEMATAFVVHHGASDPSLRVAPQVAASIYYALPRAAERMFGFSEFSFRLPSLIAMLAALFLIARIAMRLIHPAAGWFAAFLCVVLRDFNLQAADARPYALATLVAAASFWLLIRWLDSARSLDAVLFVIAASLLWRVHLLLWPMYVAFVLYASARLWRKDTHVTWPRGVIVFAVLIATLIPVAMRAMELNREAASHVVAKMPDAGDLLGSVKPSVILWVLAGAALLGRWRKWPAAPRAIPGTALALIAAWWLGQPVCLFLFSHLTGHSVFLERYLYVALPGVALAATAVAATFIPVGYWKQVSVALALIVLAVAGRWNHWKLPHHNSDWRGAAFAVNHTVSPATPVICPSPFIEARPPVWTPDYPINSFLYSHLLIYQLAPRTLPFPFETSPEAERNAASLLSSTLTSANRFVIYGGNRAAWFWREWFSARPEFAGWNIRRLGPFADVEVFIFERPAELRLTGN
jgi:Dolichyl-phosphate-mannose-protein mannosyltransferase